MIVKKIKLENWGPYVGIHEIELSNEIYGIIGCHVNDAGRSNWIGKSWFLNSIRFALYGVRPDNTVNDDSYITNGKDYGGVSLWLDDGTSIERTRKRGKSTQLTATINGYKSSQKTAQQSINQHIGLDHSDFIASHFIRQKQISKLILSRPLERTEIVNNWFRLAPLQKSFEIQKSVLVDLLDERSKLSAKREVLVDNHMKINTSAIKKELISIDNEISKVRVELDNINEQLLSFEEWSTHNVRAQEYTKLVNEGTKISEKLKQYKFDEKKYNALQQRERELSIRCNEASSKYYSLKDLYEGDTEFDGQCPITGDKCTSHEDVVNKLSSIGEQVELAEQEADLAEEKHDRVKGRLDKYNDLKSDYNRMGILREKVIELSDSHLYIQRKGIPSSSVDLNTKSQSVAVRLSELERKKVELSDQLNQYKNYKNQVKDIDNRLKKLKNKTKVTHEAIAVFGRNGVQKVIAESALGDIESLANKSLMNAGIDLSIDVTWARQGRGMATHCESCGNAFPMSLKVKVCNKCQSPRGPKIIQELDIIPSDRSGAADDIAGLVFQLAAAKWLRADRGADLSSIFIDEPFGALDRTNSQLLSNHIYSMIKSEYSFDQGFIIAHDTAVINSLPSIIRIIGSDSGSKIEVINGSK